MFHAALVYIASNDVKTATTLAQAVRPNFLAIVSFWSVSFWSTSSSLCNVRYIYLQTLVISSIAWQLDHIQNTINWLWCRITLLILLLSTFHQQQQQMCVFASLWTNEKRSHRDGSQWIYINFYTSCIILYETHSHTHQAYHSLCSMNMRILLCCCKKKIAVCFATKFILPLDQTKLVINQNHYAFYVIFDPCNYGCNSTDVFQIMNTSLSQHEKFYVFFSPWQICLFMSYCRNKNHFIYYCCHPVITPSLSQFGLWITGNTAHIKKKEYNQMESFPVNTISIQNNDNNN